MKTNASSTASARGIKRCICPCEASTKTAYGGSNLQLSMYKLHKRDQQLFFFYLMATKFILVLLSKNISKIRYSKFCMWYNITYTAIDALLYQPLRIILTFNSNRSMSSFERKYCKYDMHIYFHASFLGIAFFSLMTKTILHKVFVRTIDSLYVSINYYPQRGLRVYIISYLCAMHLYSVWRSKAFFLKSCVGLILYHLYVRMFIYLYTYSALLSRILFTSLL